jgi:hypothetical protein
MHSMRSKCEHKFLICSPSHGMAVSQVGWEGVNWAYLSQDRV